jgi:hypothetical protein
MDGSSKIGFLLQLLIVSFFLLICLSSVHVVNLFFFLRVLVQNSFSSLCGFYFILPGLLVII